MLTEDSTWASQHTILGGGALAPGHLDLPCYQRIGSEVLESYLY